MKKICFLIFVVLISQSIYSQETELSDLLRVARSIEDPSERLKTYDIIVDSLHNEEVSGDTISTGKWYTSTQINPIDDSKVITFILIADSGSGRYGDDIALIIRSSNGNNEFFINWQSYLGSDAWVTMRIGSEKAAYSKWLLSTDSKATFYPGNVNELLKKIQQTDKLVFQCTPYSDNPITLIFDVKGLKESAQEYKEDLNWILAD